LFRGRLKRGGPFLRTRERLAQHVEPAGDEDDVILAALAFATLEDDEALAVTVMSQLVKITEPLARISHHLS